MTDQRESFASRVIRDIGDALVVLSQSERMREYSLRSLIEPLREAAKRRFLFVIREQGIPIAFVVLHRKSAGDGAGAAAGLDLMSITDWETGTELAILDLFSVRGERDEALRSKAAAILAEHGARLQNGGRAG